MEKCEAKSGIFSCQPRQCRVENGGSITLFTGTTGTVSVMGAYEIISHCDQSAAEWFRVVAKLQECTSSEEKSVAAVYVYFNDLAVTVNDKQETWVCIFKGERQREIALLSSNVKWHQSVH